MSHPSEWTFCGYNEIQDPIRKNVLIDYERLQKLFGAGSYEQLKNSHRGWVEEYLGGVAKESQDEWTASIAVGGKSFVEKVKALLGFRAKGRNVVQADEGYELREGAGSYKAVFEANKDDIGPENTYFWDTNSV